MQTPGGRGKGESGRKILWKLMNDRSGYAWTSNWCPAGPAACPGPQFSCSILSPQVGADSRVPVGQVPGVARQSTCRLGFSVVWTLDSSALILCLGSCLILLERISQGKIDSLVNLRKIRLQQYFQVKTSGCCLYLLVLDLKHNTFNNF